MSNCDFIIDEIKKFEFKDKETDVVVISFDIDKFNIDDVVEDIIITISNQGTFFGLSLTSEYMTIPYQNDVNDKFLLHYKKNLENIAMFVASLSANHKIGSEE